MSKKKENQSFICGHCGRLVPPLQNGSYRNHCPYCLHSKHLDKRPGDRSHDCHGLMVPVGIHHHSKKGMQIKFSCSRCGHEGVNIAALDDPVADDLQLLLELMY